MAQWKERDIPDLSGKTVVITGGNVGLGFESARALAGRKAEVVLACRSQNRGDQAKREILATFPHAKVRVMLLDLQDLSSVAAFARELNQTSARLDVLLNNAGIMNTPHGQTRDGFELQIGTNHLGHFALTGLLLELLGRTRGSRVVTVSSAGHRAASMTFDNLHFREGSPYSPLGAYARSKLGNLLFAYELQRRFERHGMDCISLAAHPGAAQTQLGRHIEGSLVLRAFNPLLRRIVQQPARGALPQLRASVDPQVRGGEYYGPDGLFGMSGYPVRVHSSRASQSVHSARRLWLQSEELTGVTYPFSRSQTDPSYWVRGMDGRTAN